MRVTVVRETVKTETVEAEIIGRFGAGPAMCDHGITHISVNQPGLAPDRRWVLEPEKYDYLLVRVPR